MVTLNFSNITWVRVSLIIMIICVGIGEAAPVNEDFPAIDLISAAIETIILPPGEGCPIYKLPSTEPFLTFSEDIWYTRIDYPSNWVMSENQDRSVVLFESPETSRGAVITVAVPVVTGYENTPEGLQQLQNLASARIKGSFNFDYSAVKDVTFIDLPGKEVIFSGTDENGLKLTLGIVYTVVDHRIYEIDYIYNEYYPTVDISLISTMIDSFAIDHFKPSSVSASSEQNPLLFVNPPSSTIGIGGNGAVSIVMDTVPSGLSGYQITVSLSDPSIGMITDVTQPGWAGLFSATPLPGSSVTIKAADTAMEVGPGATSVLFATCKITGVKEGQCNIMIQPDMVDDDQSGRYVPDTGQGTITVSGSGPEPSFSLDLYPGWNFISTPQQLATGYDTAIIFSGVATEGRSIWMYDALGERWISADSGTKIDPFQGIWIFSGDLTSVSLLFEQNPSTASTTLQRGWNSFGPVSLITESAQTTLFTIRTSWTQMLVFNAHEQIWEPAIVNGGTGQFSDNRLLKPGLGYWLYMTEKAHLTVR